MDARLQTLVEHVREDPEFKRMADNVARFTQQGGDLRRGRPLSPRDVRGEQLGMAVALCMPEFKFSPHGQHAERLLRTTGQADIRWMFAEATRHSVPYLWNREMALLAKSMSLPRHVLGSDLFPHDAMYWTLDRELNLLNPSPGVRDATFQAWLVLRVPQAYVFCAFVEADIEGHENRTLGLAVEMVPMGSRYPDDFVGGLADDAVRFAAFLNSPFVRADPIRIAPTKKQRKRFGPRIGDPVALNVVTLRAEVREAVRVEKGDGPRWKQRWIVRGHYRAQWYPKSQSHRVIWVAPYLKGPEDAPIKQPLYAVVR